MCVERVGWIGYGVLALGLRAAAVLRTFTGPRSTFEKMTSRGL
jgi:hypothetical protein